jgi:microcystin-dependent protein
MPNPFLGEIRMFAGNFAPRDWASCDGQLLPIAQNSALFSILGTTYGGDGRTTFGLPDMRGRVPVGEGTGVGLAQVRLGERGGAEDVTLSAPQMPSHTHALNGSSAMGNAADATNAVSAVNSEMSYSTTAPDIQFNSLAVGAAGGTTPVDLHQPFVSVNFIIALQGEFPSRP